MAASELEEKDSEPRVSVRQNHRLNMMIQESSPAPEAEAETPTDWARGNWAEEPHEGSQMIASLSLSPFEIKQNKGVHVWRKDKERDLQ